MLSTCLSLVVVILNTSSYQFIEQCIEKHRKQIIFISNARILVKSHSDLLPIDVEINETFCQINSEYLILSPASQKKLLFDTLLSIIFL